jgi:hypothetical protein
MRYSQIKFQECKHLKTETQFSRPKLRARLSRKLSYQAHSKKFGLESHELRWMLRFISLKIVPKSMKIQDRANFGFVTKESQDSEEDES